MCSGVLTWNLGTQYSRENAHKSISYFNIWRIKGENDFEYIGAAHDFCYTFVVPFDLSMAFVV